MNNLNFKKLSTTIENNKLLVNLRVFSSNLFKINDIL